MKYTHISVSITEFIGYYGPKWICSCFADYNGQHEFREISHDVACKLMWELIKKGGEKKQAVNKYTHTCSDTQVTLWIFD